MSHILNVELCMLFMYSFKLFLKCMKQSVLYVVSVELACSIKYLVVIEMHYRKIAELLYICDTFDV